MKHLQILEQIELWDRVTTAQKLLLILQDKKFRDSYDMINNEFQRRWKDSKITQQTIERNCRFIQKGMGLYPPTERTNRMRKNVQKRIIAWYKKRTTFFQRLKNLFTSV